MAAKVEKVIKYDPNAKYARDAKAVDANTALTVFNSEYEQIAFLQDACTDRKLSPSEGGDFLIDRAKARAERGKATGAKYKAPAATTLSGFVAILNIHAQPWRATFMERCQSVGVTYSFLVQMARWVVRPENDKNGGGYDAKKIGPSEKEIAAKLVEFRKKSNSGRGGDTESEGNPVRQVQSAIDRMNKYAEKFGDEDGYVLSALKALRGELGRATTILAAAKLKAKNAAERKEKKAKRK